MSEVRYRDLLRALLLGEHVRAEELKAGMDESQYQHADDLISAVFCVAVEHRFARDPGPGAVRAFMDEVHRDFAGAGIKPLAAEALVRGVLGEEVLLDEVDSDDFMPIQLPLTRKIVAESASLQTGIDDLLGNGERIAAQWASQDAAVS